MLTMLPPTFGLKDSSNGGNLPFYAWYNRNHEFAAALAAQEVREARYMAALWWPVAIVSAVLIYLFAPLEVLPASVILATLVAMAPGSRRREAEFRGQSVECVVRRDHYGTRLETALDEASLQLTRYKQFDGWPQDKIRAGLVGALPEAERWALNNARLIRSAV
jgi:hypothetical protein